jgi:hypothetical protein
MENFTNVTTGEARLSYVHLFKPYAFQPGQEEKFSCTVLIPKTDMDTMNRINAAIEAAKQKGTTDKWNGICPPIIPTPVHDGDGVKTDGTAYGPECRGHWVINASAKTDYPPEVVDANLNPIINQSEIYSGIYGRVNLNFYPFSFNGKKGVGCGLGPVQKTRDGEALGGSAPSASEAFGAANPTQAVYSQQPVYNAMQPVTQQSYTAPQGQIPYGQPAINPITGLPM